MNDMEKRIVMNNLVWFRLKAIASVDYIDPAGGGALRSSKAADGGWL